MYFRLTLFNAVTLFLLALTIFVAIARFRSRPENTWFLLYYVLVLAYWRAFTGSLSMYGVAAGVACGIALKFEFLGGAFLTFVRVVELFFFGYVVWRCLALLLMWPW